MTAERTFHVSDALFVGGVVLLSVLPYLTGLGFYSDDWAFLGYLMSAPDQSVGGLLQWMLSNPIMTGRPVHSLYVALLYAAFDAEPLGYHLVNGLVLAGSAAALYGVVRQLGAARPTAVALALAWALAPHYSSVRYWFAAFQIPLSAGLFFLYLAASLRALEPSAPLRSWWFGSSWLAAALCLLSYEVFLPLLLVAPVGLWYWARRARAPGSAATAPLWAVVPLVAAIALFKRAVTTRLVAPPGGDRLAWFSQFMGDAVRSVTTGDFGLGYPLLVARAIVRYPDLVTGLVAVTIGVAVFWYLVTATRPTPTSRSTLDGGVLVPVGLVVFAAGFAIFAVTINAAIATTGTNNRTAIAGALGVALVLVGALNWLARRVPAPAARFVLGTGLGLWCAAGSYTVGTTGRAWVAAADRQSQILSYVRDAAGEWPPETLVLLDGFCPYVGPAPVVEAEWDAKGMLQLVTADPRRRADVVSPRLRITPAGIYTGIYNNRYGPYEYGSIQVVDVARRATRTLRGPFAAVSYFREFNPSRGGNCPPAVEGEGQALLRSDRPPIDLRAAGNRWQVAGRRYPALAGR